MPTPGGLRPGAAKAATLTAMFVMVGSILAMVPPGVLAAAPNAPTVNAPANGATGQITSPTLSVHVSDPDNNAMTVTFFGRPFASGVFAQIAQKTGVVSNSNTTTTWPSLGAGQKFEWYVTATDGTTLVTSADVDLSNYRQLLTLCSLASATFRLAPTPTIPTPGT